MFFKLILIVFVVFVIVYYFHSKLYYYQNKHLKIDQLETYDYLKFESSIKQKNLLIIRNYHKFNNIINQNSLQKYSQKIKLKDALIKDVINSNSNSFILNKMEYRKLPKKLKIINQFGSKLSINKDLFLSYGKKEGSTSIINLKYDRNIFHVLKGELTIFLFQPSYNKKLYLNKTDNQSILFSDIDVRKVDYQKYPKYKKVESNTIQIKLREGHLLYIPNSWSYYIIYNKESILLNYCFHTVVSKIISYL